jgi:hypothetical protein
MRCSDLARPLIGFPQLGRISREHRERIVMPVTIAGQLLIGADLREPAGRTEARRSQRILKGGSFRI